MRRLCEVLILVALSAFTVGAIGYGWILLILQSLEVTS
jgi:hypothetical protein